MNMAVMPRFVSYTSVIPSPSTQYLLSTAVLFCIHARYDPFCFADRKHEKRTALGATTILAHRADSH